MDNDLPQTHPHLTPEAQARRRRLGEQFDRAACTADESLENALAMVEQLKPNRWYLPAPKSR